MTSTLPGCMTGSARCARVAASICAVTSWTSRAGIRDPWIQAEVVLRQPHRQCGHCRHRAGEAHDALGGVEPVTAIACIFHRASMSVVAASISAGWVGRCAGGARSSHPTFSLTLAPTGSRPNELGEPPRCPPPRPDPGRRAQRRHQRNSGRPPHRRDDLGDLPVAPGRRRRTYVCVVGVPGRGWRPSARLVRRRLDLRGVVGHRVPGPFDRGRRQRPTDVNPPPGRTTFITRTTSVGHRRRRRR